MQSPLWNLIVQAVSAAAIILHLIAGALVASTFLGSSDNVGAAVAGMIAAAVAAITAIVLSNLSSLRLSATIKRADEDARRLAQGELNHVGDPNASIASLADVAGYISEKARVAQRISGGDLETVCEVRSDGDVLGNAQSTMIDYLRSELGPGQSREALQRSIVKLLDEVSEVASGDLTVQAEVGPEITGEIADAFNSMTRNLRSLIKQVKDVTSRVGTSASTISGTTEQLAQGSIAQASQIAHTTAAISEMAIKIRDVASTASVSAEVASDSLTRSRSGTKASRENIEAMNCVRRQVQETAKRIKKLGERAQEIGQIVGLIDDLSDRTGLLALNASLQASSAGESQTGFVLVAEEVERLADRSNRLTQQISALTQTINVETKEVVASMEETIQEVVLSSALAEKAGRSLADIEETSGRLAELLRSIAESAASEAKSSGDITSAMASISEVTDLVQTGARRAAESVRILVELSHELRNSVAPFKLPADMNSASSPAPSRFLN